MRIGVEGLSIMFSELQTKICGTKFGVSDREKGIFFLLLRSTAIKVNLFALKVLLLKHEAEISKLKQELKLQKLKILSSLR